MLTTMPTLTLDDAVIALVASDEATALASQDLNHRELTFLLERMGWRPAHNEKFQNTPRGLVSKWLTERGIPLHPRTRRLQFDDLVTAAATPGKLQPTSHLTLRRRAMDAQTTIAQRLTTMSEAVTRAERLAVARKRGLALLEDELEEMRGELDSMVAEEQRLYDAGDRINTITRLNPTLPS